MVRNAIGFDRFLLIPSQKDYMQLSWFDPGHVIVIYCALDYTLKEMSK